MHLSILLPVRRIIAIWMIVIGSLSLISQTASAQDCGGRGGPPPISSGTEFLLVFMQNEAPIYIGDVPAARYQDIYMASNADVPDTVTITCKAFPAWRVVLNLAVRSSAVYRLSTDSLIGYPNQDPTVESDEIIASTVFKVVSTSPITCYGMNNRYFTADAFLALPRSAATTDYLVMAYYNSTILLGDQNMPSEFAVASFEDNDTVTITPSAITRTGNPKGKAMTFVLDSGECVQIQGAPNDILGDMTGSIVSAQKKVVVYGGSVRTEAPTGYTHDQGTSRDHLCEAMPPLSTWGISFIAKNFGRSDGDIMRVLASVDNTIVKINGKVWGAPLMANKFRDTLLAQSAIALENIAAVESDKPILVGMIAHTATPSDASSGDPFLAIVPPLDQTYNDFTYFITNDIANYTPTQQFLIIATEQSGAGLIKIGNFAPLPRLAYTMLPYVFKNGKKYAVTTVNQDSGIHRIISPNIAENGFTILAYGWGDVISYGYTAGALLRPHTGIISLPAHTFGASPGPGGPAPGTAPSITVRNIMAEKIYFDSALITYSQNKEHIAVRLKKDIASETGTIETAEEKTLELVASQRIQESITGSIRIWYHTRLWGDLLPVDFPFVITPESQADVNATSHQTVVLENYPNPASGRTTIHFAIAARAHASVKIYDALGRVVRIVMQAVVNSGDQTIQVSTQGLIPGDYTLELLSAELGISEHRKMIVIE